MFTKNCLFFGIASHRTLRITSYSQFSCFRFQSNKCFLPVFNANCALIARRCRPNINRLDFSRCFCNKKQEIDSKTDETETFDYIERDFEELTIDKYKELIRNDEDEKTIKRILESYEYVKYTSEIVPSTLSLNDMKKLMQEKQAYSEYFLRLYNKEMRRLQRERTKQIKSIQIAEKRKAFKEDAPKTGIAYDSDSGAPLYGLWHNSLYISIASTSLNAAALPRLLASSQFGTPLIFDFDFDDRMSDKEIHLLAVNLRQTFSGNKSFDYPFNVFFCNYKRNSKVDKYLRSDATFFKGCANFANITHKSYLDLYPKKKLIYLTSDSRQEMTHFDHDAIYIIGATYDYGHKRSDTYSKARAEGVKNVRLPLKQYVVLRNMPDLHLSEMIKVLNELKTSGDWKECFKHLDPNRVRSVQELQETQVKRLEMMHSKAKRSKRRKSLFTVIAEDTM